MMVQKTVLVLVLFFNAALVRAQDEEPYRLSVLGGAGYNWYISNTPELTSTAGGFSGMIRIMWHPEHRPSVGLETGYVFMYSIDEKNIATEFGTTDVFAARTGIPLILVFSMDIAAGIQVSAGWGQIFVIGTVESFGNRVHSSSFSTGFIGSGSYIWPVSDLFEVGGEVKWYHASKFEDTGISVQVVGRWTFLEW